MSAVIAPAAWAAGTPSAADLEALTTIAPASVSPAVREWARRALAQPSGEKEKPGDEADKDEADRPTDPPRERTRPRVRLQAGDTVLIRFEPPAKTDAPERAPAPPPPLDEKTKEQLKLRDARVPGERVFELDSAGALVLTHVGRIPLAGLSEEEAAERVGAEPAFQGLEVSLKRLPLERELKPFGYDVFHAPSKTFAPATDIPVPTDYVLGPGDTLVVQLFGKENDERTLRVTREGRLLIPGLGPLSVAGKKFSQLEKELQSRVERQLIGTRVAVSLGRLRSIRVFVLGDVERPGAYTVSSLATLTHALLASGGVKPYGSLRNVQLKRGGELVGSLDLYDLLLRGDSGGDAALLPGDVIFVPPIGMTAGIGGRVRRPALYELKGESSVDTLVQMAGGLLPDADAKSAQLARIDEDGVRRLRALELAVPADRSSPLRDGDEVRIFPVVERMKHSVSLAGQVERPGRYPWRTGMRLSDLLASLDALRPDADSLYVLIHREDAAEGVVLRGANPRAALENRGGDSDPLLRPGDEVRAFAREENRATLIQPLLDRARTGAGPARPSPEVSVEGAVHHPGRYPWSPAMSLRDLLDASGGLTDRAYLLQAELTRYTVIQGQAREQARELVDVRSPEGASRMLAPYDRLVVRRIPKWEEEGTVEIQGEVRFPGKYPIAPGERMSSVLQRAGGLTADAYTPAAVFLRESVRQREQEHLAQLTAQLERDLALVTTGGAELGIKKEAAVAEGQTLLKQMRAAKATGRMVIKLEDALTDRAGYDVVMQPGDRLVVPRRPDEVTVVGEVYYPTSHLYVDRYGRDAYVRMSGGITERGNKRAVYVVHANGSVSPPTGWFGGDVDVGPGDTVIVPLKVDRVSNLKLFTDVSTILFQLAVTAAALDSIGIL